MRSALPSLNRLWAILAGLATVFLLSGLFHYRGAAVSVPMLAPAREQQVTLLPILIKDIQPSHRDYIVLGWNDLGMHCYNRDFRDLAVLPPFNTLWAQVIYRGNPPQVITSGVTVKYSFPQNATSVGKSDFWDYAQQLFGVDLPPDTGLTGNTMAGEMEPQAGYFIADGIPLTEFEDGDLVNPQPYQLAEIVVKDQLGNILATQQVVAPVSTEMHCDSCHFDGNIEDIATGRIETNILTLHDREHQEAYPPGHQGALMDRRPILCAECHASNALGASGVSGLPNLSHAMHDNHAEAVPDSLEGCYNCHPGPQTRCLRDVMSQTQDMDCIDCHGGMAAVKENPNPWLNEPRCDGCHTEAQYAQDHALYRFSKGHGGVYCEGCHDSTHAIAESREPRDALKFIALQGHPGTLEKCTVCHLTQPEGEIHSIP